MEKGKRPGAPSKKKKQSNKNDSSDPVKNFELWKKKYNKTKTRVKQEKKQKRKPEWQLEKDNIQRLVKKYDEVSSHGLLCRV